MTRYSLTLILITTALVYCDNRRKMADTERKTLNIATKTKGMNYNVQLYAKILLENQTNKQVTKHSTRHLTINEVCYETSTERLVFSFEVTFGIVTVTSPNQSQFEGITDASLGFSENCDYSCSPLFRAISTYRQFIRAKFNIMKSSRSTLTQLQ